MQAEAMQSQIASGEPVAVDDLVRVNSEARRAIGMLKAKAVKSKPPAPTIHDLVAELGADEASEGVAS